MAQTIQADVRSLAPDVPVQGVATLDAALRQTLAPRTFSLALLAAFAGFALLLAAGGLYGVISYAVARRAREIAIRMALGAQRIEVLRSVLTQELRWLAIGLAVGLGGAWGLGQALRNMLFGIGASDVATFAAVIVLLGAVSVAACWNPASRAVRVDPLTVLREE
jgi:putative ABC transport system permease protein